MKEGKKKGGDWPKKRKKEGRNQMDYHHKSKLISLYPQKMTVRMTQTMWDAINSLTAGFEKNSLNMTITRADVARMLFAKSLDHYSYNWDDRE